MNPIPLSVPMIGELEKRWINQCLDSGYISTSGPLIARFEQEFAHKVAGPYAVATVSGTAALHVCLRVLGIGAQDRVIVPDLTFIASVNPILYCGAQPVFVDVNRETWSLDAPAVREVCRHFKDSDHPVKAILPVHLYGCACPVRELAEIAREFDLRIIEDATESLGTTMNGKQVGTSGDMGCFSFNGNKLLTTGGGGMIVTASKQYADRARYLLNQAYDDPEYFLHGDMGYNYRLNNIAAALGLAQLERMPDILAAKRRIAARYDTLFSGIQWIQSNPQPEGVASSFWLYSVVLDSEERRDQWLTYLHQQHIAARRFFRPLHRQPYLSGQGVWSLTAEGLRNGPEGVSDDLYTRGLNLPGSPGMTDEELEYITSHLTHLLTRA
ncbi:MAG: aminotransferase class I/II-fold pyridoxal phosphate-dependent enzyme [Spartobacteria bacterium]|nr:aminotransferase class I/II-fold pyridoxal phosphate-dependent enzyme [Spartobacteria bacterium]